MQITSFNEANNYYLEGNCFIVTELPRFVYILVKHRIHLLLCRYGPRAAKHCFLKTSLEMNWTDPMSIGYMRPKPITLVYHRKQSFWLQKI